MSKKEVVDPEELIIREDTPEQDAEDVVDESVSDAAGEDSEESADQAPDLEEPESELDKAKAEVVEYRDRMARLQAEMENLRKRTARDIQNAHKFALESFAKELLSVADSMDLGMQAAGDTDDVSSIIEGMELTSKQLFGVLEKFNVEIMDAQGMRFDPEQHEAMTMVPNPDMEPNTVMDVIQKGYTLNDRLLRPARVIVSS
ncbi:MAG: nucleotide exchange factor GrpE [Gammaproteobacteria bacterium]|uniref:Protein GrpE n=1 Tax=Candidatus Thiopontia autotrophica TaxID=2841688 RepID=A0A8J6NY00_9GAMM|nr:nucleotide exchange factor GrpE [Candidatus Thiopontia autotrophica]MBL6969536.1 nucleotide exchange factor GrpE [Gammaproteobacteria bacterium]